MSATASSSSAPDPALASAAVSVNETLLLKLSAEQHQFHSSGGNSTVQLSVADYLAIRQPPLRMLYFYDAHDRESVFRSTHAEGSARQHMDADVLVASLNKILSSYPLLTGSLTLGQGGKPIIKMTNAGVTFVRAKASVPLATLGLRTIENLSTLPAALQLVAPLPPPAALWSKDPLAEQTKLPLLQVQHTTFTCGSVCLGISLNRAVGDAQSFFHLVAHWSHLCSKQLGLESLDAASPQTSDFEPLHNRSLLEVELEEDAASKEEKSDVLDPAEEKRLKAKRAYVPSAYQVFDAAAAARGLSTEPPPTTFRLFRFSADELDNLKNAAELRTSFSHVTKQPATFETLTTFLFRSIARARGLGEQASRPLKLLVEVNVRLRLQPRLPGNYFGNASLVASSLLSSQSLIKQNLATSASVVTQALGTGMAPGNNYCVLQWAVKQNPLTLARASDVGRPDSQGLDVQVLAHQSYPIYHVDFGWGRPLRVVPAAPAHNPDGCIVLLPGKEEDGSIDAYVALKQEVMDRMVKDPEFGEFKTAQIP